MKFEYIKGCCKPKIEEQYILLDECFNDTPTLSVDTYVAIQYLYLGIDSVDMCIKSLWGTSPRASWKETTLFPPNAVEGSLKIIGECEAGLTYRIDCKKMWESYFDKDSEWFCIGNPIFREGDNAVKICNNMIVVINSINELIAVWIQPIFV